MFWFLAALGALVLFAVVVAAVLFVVAKQRSQKPVAVDAFGDPIVERSPTAVGEERPPLPAPPLVEPAPVERSPVAEPAPRLVEAAPAPAEPTHAGPTPAEAPLAEPARTPGPPPMVEPAPIPAPLPTLVAPPPEREAPAAPAPSALPHLAARPTIVADLEPEPAPPAELVTPPAELEQLEKLRIADLDLVVRANAVRLAGDDLLAFTTEGFSHRGRRELVLYAPRASCSDADVVRSLKRFAALALTALERPEPVGVGEVLKVPGDIGGVPLAGFLVVEPNEPGPVAIGDHVVVIGLSKADAALDPAAVRAALVERSGGVPYRTVVAG